MPKIINGESFTTFEDIWEASNLTQTEKDAIDLKVAIVGKLIEAREKKGVSQRQLAEMTGLQQPSIARLETMRVKPRVDTFLRVLRPLGYTLAVVPLEESGAVRGGDPAVGCQK